MSARLSLCCRQILVGTAVAWGSCASNGASAELSAKSFYDYPGIVGNIEPVGESPPVDDALLRYGEWRYRGLCVRCHGVSGDGEGADWTLTEYDPVHWLPRKPRSFKFAVFKLSSTPTGSLPTDEDLFGSISRGLLPARDMPAFKFLPERDRWALIAYIKSFSDIWEEAAEWQAPPIEIGEPPLPSAQMIEAGKAVYKSAKCAKCHGESGKGGGPSADELTDDNDLPITPRDFTDPSQFVGPSGPRGVYRTFTTGLSGTPMPSFGDSLNEEQRWQLVWYVISLRPGWELEQARREIAEPRNTRNNTK